MAQDLELIEISDLDELTTPGNDDLMAIQDGNVLKKITYENVKKDMIGTTPEYTTDDEPYLIRKTKKSGVVGKCALNKLVGGSLGWNQLNVNDRTSGSANGITATKDSSGTWTLSGTATATALINPVTSSTFNLVANHVMYLGGCPSGGTTNTYQLDVRKSGVIVAGAIDVGNGVLFKVAESGAHSINMRVASGTTVNSIKYTPQLIDLTQMFGSTIADYVYGLGSTNGIAWLSKYIDLGTYHAYDAGSIQSVQATAHVTTGFQQWDEAWELGTILDTNGQNSAATNRIRSTNYIPIFADSSYYIKSPKDVKLYWYDGNKNFISASSGWTKNAIFNPHTAAKYMRFITETAYGATYTNDICINISKATGTPKNGDYVPYNGHTYPLGSDTLRGYPMLVNNKLAFDGDIKTPDGTIRRKYGIVDLGSLTYTGDSGGFVLSASIGAKVQTTQAVMAKLICSKYPTIMQSQLSGSDKCVYGLNWGNGIGIRDSAYSTPAAFKTAMSGVYLVYELATETTESSTSYQKIQTIDADGTESFTTSSPVPVGHETQTPDNILAALGWLGE